MPSLADVQRRIRDAVVTGDALHVTPAIGGGAVMRDRLIIHQRHYEASLVKALRAKFPACAWLLGGEAVAVAARDFVRQCPPARPCIAEYGACFPRALSTHPPFASMPYLLSFAELEWHVGQVSIAIDAPPAGRQGLASLGTAAGDHRVRLQPGVRYLQAGWPVDELLRFYLTDSAPERYVMEPLDVRLEIRGARGAFLVRRLAHGDYAFRAAVAAGDALADAAARGFAADHSFDAGRALVDLVGEGLATSVGR